jgi:Flp pilus assembly protein TadG
VTGRRSRREVARRDDAGSAVVEFVFLGVLLLVPLVYLVLALGHAQAAAFAADSAARAAARAFTTAPDEATGRARALAAVRLALRDQGFDQEPASTTRLACSARPCLMPNVRVSVEVSVDVVLPGIPSAVDRIAGAHVTVRSRQSVVVDAFRPPRGTSPRVSPPGAGSAGAGSPRVSPPGAGSTVGAGAR